MFSPLSPPEKKSLHVSKSKPLGPAQEIQSLLTPPVKRTFLSSSDDESSHFYLSVSPGCSYKSEMKGKIHLWDWKAYGNPLPVFVAEAVTSVERMSDISVRIEETGWAILICGRRLFIWKFKQDYSDKTYVINCRELTLPPSDLAHKADLVRVFMTEESIMPSVLAVSPEGLVRYWPSIFHEERLVDATIDLQGQECYSLTCINPLGYVLATTTGSLVLITPSIAGGQHAVICRSVRLPQGILTGIGRRLSSFIFGAVPAQAVESKQLTKVLAADGPDKKSCFLYVLSFCTLQKWQMFENGSDQLLFEHDLDRWLKERFFHYSYYSGIPATESFEVHQLKVLCVDMQLTDKGIVILTASTDHSKIVDYGLVVLGGSSSSEYLNILSFGIIRQSKKNQDDNEEWIWKFKLLLPSKDSLFAYMYSKYEIFYFSVFEPNSDCDLIDASMWGDILGGGIHQNIPVFFTKTHGLLSLQLSENSKDECLEVTPEQEEMTEKIIFDTPEGLHTTLKELMCQYYNKEMRGKCLESVEDMKTGSSSLQFFNDLDSAVIKLSIQIIDDYPVSDPRWCESVPAGDHGSSSLIILHQLEDKVKVHEYLINFLKAVGLYTKLSTLRIEETEFNTKALLCEHAEKLVAAKMIRRQLGQPLNQDGILDAAIRECLGSRKLKLKNHLTHEDMFFREVSSIQTLFKAVFDVEVGKLLRDIGNPVKIVTTVNKIFLDIFSEVLQYRKTKEAFYDFMPLCELKLPYRPWTCSEGREGLRTVMSNQHKLNVEYLLRASESDEKDESMYKQIEEILDFLLHGYLCELESVKNTDQFTCIEAKYIKQRYNLLEILVKFKKFEMATSLAERYLDFDILMEICSISGETGVLKRYMSRFSEKGFPEFMFRWYLKKGMKKDIFLYSLSHPKELSQVLEDHAELAWQHYLKIEQYDLALKILKELGVTETKFIFKRKTLLSLAKLTALASDLAEDEKSKHISETNFHLNYILHQERLPDSVVMRNFLQPEFMELVKPEELIEMYVSDENTGANCYDFKIALEMLVFLNKPPGDSQYEKLRKHIWCKAVLRDNWDALDAANPVDAVRTTTFFQTIELAFNQGLDLHDFVLPVEDLLQSPELSTIAESANFRFLIRTGYEQVLKVAAGS